MIRWLSKLVMAQEVVAETKVLVTKEVVAETKEVVTQNSL